jgi:hypothetical protein
MSIAAITTPASASRRAPARCSGRKPRNRFTILELLVGHQPKFAAGFIETTTRSTLSRALPPFANARPLGPIAGTHLRLETHIAFSLGAQRIRTRPESDGQPSQGMKIRNRTTLLTYLR